MIKCPGIATKWYSINHDIFFNCLIIMGILFYSLTSRCSSQNGIVSFSIRLADFQARGVARVKLHHLLQKGSFFLIKLAAVQASWAAPTRY